MQYVLRRNTVGSRGTRVIEWSCLLGPPWQSSRRRGHGLKPRAKTKLLQLLQEAIRTARYVYLLICFHNVTWTGQCASSWAVDGIWCGLAVMIGGTASNYCTGLWPLYTNSFLSACLESQASWFHKNTSLLLSHTTNKAISIHTTSSTAQACQHFHICIAALIRLYTSSAAAVSATDIIQPAPDLLVT